MANGTSGDTVNILAKILAKLTNLVGSQQRGLTRFDMDDGLPLFGNAVSVAYFSGNLPAIKQVAVANKRRKAILFTLVNGGAITVHPTTFQIDQNRGFWPPTTGYLEFTKTRHGDMVQGDWFSVHGVAGPILTVVEIF